MFSSVLPYIKTGYKYFNRALLISTVITTVLFIFAHFIAVDKKGLAGPSVTTQNQQELSKIINNPELMKTKEGKLQKQVLSSITCNLIGDWCPNSSGNFQTSIFGRIGGLITMTMTNPPASGVLYVYENLQQSHIIPQTYAAEGMGFAALRPLQGIWKVFRDISYLVLVLVMIVIGFMIMFRSKLGGSTAVSIETALPRIVISLILITFSFAIAGFLIDMMYVITAIAISALSGDPAKPFYDAGTFQNKYLAATPDALLEVLFPYDPTAHLPGELGALKSVIPFPYTVFNSIANVYALSQNLVNILPSSVVPLFYLVGSWASLIVTNTLMSTVFQHPINMLSNLQAATFGIGEGLSGFIKFIGAIALLTVIGFFILPLIMGLIILFTIFGLFMRIFLILLTTYVRILLLVILSPIYLLMEAFPGRNAFADWMKSLVGELLTFPVVIISILLAYIIVNTSGYEITDSIAAGLPGPIGQVISPNSAPATYWTPPFLYGLNQKALSFIVGMTIIFLIPDLIKMMRETLGVKESSVGINPAMYFASGVGLVQNSFGIVSQVGHLSHGASVLRPTQQGASGGGFGGILGRMFGGGGHHNP
jgi:hypothetical protein